ncbi:MAG: ATP-binding protein [Bacteroidales bacterium]|jgi:NadR type nicotinamide-nucleotide adenylyltransferase|nr:ATP-binding protein [Bacteroidales bacterium]
MFYRIAITGPESTGKSLLTARLAQMFRTSYVNEFARDYIDAFDRPYQYEDLLSIAQGQIASEDEAAKNATRILFCDTELTVIKIWSEVRYEKCDHRIIDLLNNRSYDLYLVMDVDLPWEYDPQREHPGFRPQLLEMYIQEMKNRSLPWELVSGDGPDRLLNALNHIYRHFPELESVILNDKIPQINIFPHD